MLAIILVPMQLAERRQNFGIAIPASKTPLAALRAPAGWEIDVGYEVRAVWRPLGWTVTVGRRWEALVDPAVSGPAKTPEELIPGAPPLETYIGPHLDRRRAELSTSGIWRLGFTLIDDETLEAVTIDMLRSGETTRYFVVAWQVPFVVAVAAMLACAVYFTIATVTRGRTRQAVELAASASSTGNCPECSYPTEGLEIGICPECGWDHAHLKRRLEVLRMRYQSKVWARGGRLIRPYFR